MISISVKIVDRYNKICESLRFLKIRQAISQSQYHTDKRYLFGTVICLLCTYCTYDIYDIYRMFFNFLYGSTLLRSLLKIKLQRAVRIMFSVFF
jgi:hypothetical protein